MRPDAGEGEKRTNEIGTVIPLLETLPDIANRTVTADALLTQRALAKYLLGRSADYLFTVKGNQPTLHDDIRLLLDETIARRAPDFMNEGAKPEHGRRERRSIWVSSGLRLGHGPADLSVCAAADRVPAGCATAALRPLDVDHSVGRARAGTLRRFAAIR